MQKTDWGIPTSPQRGQELSKKQMAGGTQSKNQTPSHNWEKKPLIVSHTHGRQPPKETKSKQLPPESRLRFLLLQHYLPSAQWFPTKESRVLWKAGVAQRPAYRQRRSPLSHDHGKLRAFDYKALVLGSVLSVELAQPRAQGDDSAGVDRRCTHQCFPWACGTQIFLFRTATI